MSDWKRATPVSLAGKPYRAAERGPPLFVREATDDEVNCAVIVVPVEDHENAAARELHIDTGEPTQHLAFHKREARILCRLLIGLLAKDGDPVAEKIEAYTAKAYEEAQAEEVAAQLKQEEDGTEQTS